MIFTYSFTSMLYRVHIEGTSGTSLLGIDGERALRGSGRMLSLLLRFRFYLMTYRGMCRVISQMRSQYW